MKPKINILPLIVYLLSMFTLNSIQAKAQTYLPVGPQTNVPVSTVTTGGWTECYIDTYDNFMNAETVLAQCPGERLMLSCRETGNTTLMLLAQGERSDVTFDTGENAGETHIANGVGWYFNISPMGEQNFGQNAWGFVSAGEMVIKDNCDFQITGDDRLCWHLQGNLGGWRCGDIENLNSSTEYERIVYVPGAAEPIPTLSEWSLIAMAGILGLVGFMVIRRRKVAA